MSCLFLVLNLLKVEIQLLTFKNVTVRTTGLTRTGSNDGIETTSVELIINMGFNLGEFLAFLKLAKD